MGKPDYPGNFSCFFRKRSRENPSPLDGKIFWRGIERNFTSLTIAKRAGKKVFGNHDPSKRDLLGVFCSDGSIFNIREKAAPVIHHEYDSLLNVTVREIAQDVDSALPYAREDMFGLVILFTIDRTIEAEKGILAMASQLIDLAVSLGGTFYLPYRNFASPGTNQRGYPGFSRFLAKKKEFDPQEIFSSGFISSIARTKGGY